MDLSMLGSSASTFSLDSSVGLSTLNEASSGSQAVVRRKQQPRRGGPKKRANASALEKEVILTHSLRTLHEEERKVDLLYTMARLEEDLQNGSRKDFEDDVNDDASLASMASSVTLKKKAKGGSVVRTQQQREVRCFCKLGKALLVSDLRSGMDRRAAEYVGAEGLRDFAQSKLHVSLSPTEVGLVMGVLDLEATGLVDVYAVLEMARLHFNKYRKLKQQQKDVDARRGPGGAAVPPVATGGRGGAKKPHKTAEEEARDNEITINRILNRMRVVSYELLLSKDMRALSRPRPYILNSEQFQEALDDFGVHHLPLGERKLLEERYCAFYPPRAGSVDFSSFKSEFISLGGEVLIARRRTPGGTARFGTLNGTDNFALGGTLKGAKTPLPALPSVASGPGTGARGTVGAKALPPIPTVTPTPAVPSSAAAGGGGATPSLSHGGAAAATSSTPGGSRRSSFTSKVNWSTKQAAEGGSRPSTPRPRRSSMDSGPTEGDGAANSLSHLLLGGAVAPLPVFLEPSIPLDQDTDAPLEFEGHPDIAPEVTMKRNKVLRKSFEAGTFMTPRSARSSFGDEELAAMTALALTQIEEDDDADTGDPATQRELEDRFQPLAMGLPPRRLSKTSSNSALLQPVSARRDMPVTGRRDNTHRRVSELIREAQRPGAPAANNMAANLTEQAHAFTSSIAIMNMIFASAELMIEAIKAANSPTLGLSSDFHRRFSTIEATKVFTMRKLTSLNSLEDHEDGDTSPESTPGSSRSSCATTPVTKTRKSVEPPHAAAVGAAVPIVVSVDGAVTFPGYHLDPTTDKLESDSTSDPDTSSTKLRETLDGPGVVVGTFHLAP